MTEKELILQDSESIFRRYFGNFKLNKYYKSPFRKEKNPSFNIFVNRGGTLFYKDFGHSSGDAISFVMNLFNASYKEAVKMITTDLNINVIKSLKDIKYKSEKAVYDKPDKKILQPIYNTFNGRPIYNEVDTKFWLEDLKVRDVRYLLKHNIYSARELLINKARVWSATSEDPIYIYAEKYKNEWWRKAYRPLNKEGDKWRSDYPNAARMLHNLSNLDYSNKELIITKSNKDCVVLDSIGFNVINTQSEDIAIPEDIITYLKKYFDIYLLYDCDYNKAENYGYNLSDKYSEMHKIKQIKIPVEYECTDSADLIKKFQPQTLYNLIKTWQRKQN